MYKDLFCTYDKKNRRFPSFFLIEKKYICIHTHISIFLGKKITEKGKMGWERLRPSKIVSIIKF